MILLFLLALLVFAGCQVYTQALRLRKARASALREENTVTLKTRPWSRGLQIHRGNK